MRCWKYNERSLRKGGQNNGEKEKGEKSEAGYRD
jgi:hypothetical protein